MTTCRIEMINAGRAYPRTCPTCGLTGNCVNGLLPDQATKRVSAAPAITNHEERAMQDIPHQVAAQQLRAAMRQLEVDLNRVIGDRVGQFKRATGLKPILRLQDVPAAPQLGMQHDTDDHTQVTVNVML